MRLQRPPINKFGCTRPFATWCMQVSLLAASGLLGEKLPIVSTDGLPKRLQKFVTEVHFQLAKKLSKQGELTVWVVSGECLVNVDKYEHHQWVEYEIKGKRYISDLCLMDNDQLILRNPKDLVQHELDALFIKCRLSEYYGRQSLKYRTLEVCIQEYMRLGRSTY